MNDLGNVGTSQVPLPTGESAMTSTQVIRAMNNKLPVWGVGICIQALPVSRNVLFHQSAAIQEVQSHWTPFFNDDF